MCSKTAKVLHQWRKRQAGSSAPTIFPSLRGNVLTRDSVNHLLREIVQLAIPACPSLTTKRVTPHLIRHGTAMHLLQSGVDITVIALWLGHEERNKTEQNEEKFLLEPLKKILPSQHPVLKPVSLPDYQIGAEIPPQASQMTNPFMPEIFPSPSHFAHTSAASAFRTNRPCELWYCISCSRSP